MSEHHHFAEITPELTALANQAVSAASINPELYGVYDVKRGLRDINGNGVLAGLTRISDIRAFTVVNGEKVPTAGELYYRGYRIEDLVQGFLKDRRFGFEETAYLLLFGSLPDAEALARFQSILAGYRTLPTSFVRDIIMKAPSRDMMNTLARSVLTLYSYDTNADDITPPNVLRQCLQLIALFPLLSVYGYQAFRHYHDGQSLFIHVPQADLSTAENILMLLRDDCKYTALEAKVLDLALVLHAEHGGGNNSTFATHVVSSSGTDTYSAIAAALGSLKGPRHGGANIKVVRMFDDMKQHIYGMGHAVYSLSDPRADILRGFVERLSEEKGLQDDYALYARVGRLAPQVIAKERRIYKGVSANIDFYSGFAYSMLGLPLELYTPIFAIARIAGWSAHRLEEMANAGKIIRPSYKNIAPECTYIPLSDR